MESEIKLFEEAQKVTNDVTRFLNGFRSKELNKAFCEAMDCDHRTLQQNFTGLCLAWIEHIGNQDASFKSRHIDGRNEYSNKICGEISDFMKEKGINSNLPCV